MAEGIALFLLLFFALGLGWALARWQFRRERRREERVSNHYFRGLNYLLNEEPDKAIDIFLELAERKSNGGPSRRRHINHEVIDTHLALGSLFRRRGEMDKAIRFHKHIIAQPNLTEEQRTQALKALGRDYLKAGLLDRAERLFSQLVERQPGDNQPAQQLLDIYQQEKDWPQAIEQAQHLHAEAPDQTGALLAQFYCELAEQALRQNDAAQAQKALRQARRYQSDHPRAHIVAGHMAQSNDEPDKAIAHFQQACEKDPQSFVLISEHLMACHQNQGTLQALQAWLEQFVDLNSLSSATIMLANLRARSDVDEGVSVLVKGLENHPTIRGLEALVDLLAQHGRTLASVDPGMIGQLMARLREAQPRYRCKECGYSSSQHHWCCPSCRQWGSTRLVAGPWGD